MSELQKNAGPSTASIQAEIASTKDSLAQTLHALEAKLSQGDLPGKIDAKIEQVEERAKALLTEKLKEAKSAIQEEMGVAKKALQAELGALEVKARQGASDAADRLRGEVYQFKDSIKCDVRDAFTDAKQSLRAATVGRVENLATTIGDTMTNTRTTIIETVRANPIPAALVGAGLAWMILNRVKSAQQKSRGEQGSAAGEDVEVIDDGTGFVEAQVSKAAQGVAAFTGRVGAAVQTKARALAQNASEVGSKIAKQAGIAVDRGTTMAKEGVQRAGAAYDTTLQENPMLIAGAAIAFGLLIGFSLPRTRREDQLMGAQRDRLLQRAGQGIQDGASSLANVAEDAMDKAQRPSKAPARA